MEVWGVSLRAHSTRVLIFTLTNICVENSLDNLLIIMTPTTASIFSDVTYCGHGQRPFQSFIRGRSVAKVGGKGIS